MRAQAMAIGVLWLMADVTRAAAAAPDTWVSGTGVDAGKCPASAPCRSFQYALKQTREGGVIAVQSSGSFAGVTVNKSVTITADGVVALIRTPVGCGAVICVDAQSGYVTLRGLTIDPMSRGNNGITILNVRLFHLKHSVVRQARIGLSAKAPSDSLHGNLEVADTTLSQNDIGIKVAARGYTRLSLDRVRVHDNTDGIAFDQSDGGGTIIANVTDSVVAGQTGYGIYAVSSAPVSTFYPNVSVTLDRTAVLYNGKGIVAAGEASRVRIGNTTMTGNDVALHRLRGGVIPSYGTNKLDGDGSGETPSLTIPNQ